jgi:hypothetical protein
MATRDYGGILVKNGKIFQNDDWSMMTTDLGYQLPEGVNSYAAAGDEKFAVAVWKANLYVIINGKVAHTIWLNQATANNTDYPRTILAKPPYEKFINIGGSGVDLTVEQIDKEYEVTKYGAEYRDKYHVHFTYSGNVYDIYFGYGVDNNVSIYSDLIANDLFDYSETERETFNRIFGL